MSNLVDKAMELQVMTCLDSLLNRANHDEYLQRIGKKEALRFLEENSKYADIIKSNLQRLEAIENSNPSEALECLDRIDNTLCLNNIKGKLEFGIDTEEHSDCDSVIGMVEDLETIKQALLKAQENARSEEILQKYYQDGITLDSVRALREEMAELKEQAQKPKKYLKWEDLAFKEEEQTMKILLNGSCYLLNYYTRSEEEFVFIKSTGTTIFNLLGKCSDDKQLFNDLHLERVEE